MERGPNPTESYDGRVTVRVLRDEGPNDRVRCSSYEDAIAAVDARAEPGVVVKIEDRDGEVVFTSAEMDIDDWAAEWKRAKRRQSPGVEVRECPNGNRRCFADARCVPCQLDEVQRQY